MYKREDLLLGGVCIFFFFFFFFFFYHNCVLKREWLITGCFLYKRKGLITGY